MQLNAYVLECVRGLSREHELGPCAAGAAIREATEARNEGMLGADMNRAQGAANKLAELFRQSACSSTRICTRCASWRKTPKALIAACRLPGATAR